MFLIILKLKKIVVGQTKGHEGQHISDP